jgi:ABC-2 type transport system ATP-binding protein
MRAVPAYFASVYRRGNFQGLNNTKGMYSVPPVLEAIDIVKHYGKLVAVDGVSFSVEAGTCFGLLGPNGAGKTTTIEVIEDVDVPTSGEILYKGKPRTPRFREEVGIQFQQTSLLEFLSIRNTLEVFAALYEHPRNIDELMELCSLSDIQKQMNNRISGGQRQRLMLALALVNQPTLIFLDEPSTGLDPHARWDLWQVVEQIKAQGDTLILTTHYMEEAQRLCDDIAIMDHGKIIARGSPESLIRTHCEGSTVILPKSSLKRPLTDLDFPFTESENRVEISCDDINQCLGRLMQMDTNMNDVLVRSPNLETVFLNLTGRQLRE